MCLGGDGKVNVRRDIRKIRSVCPSIYLHPITVRTSTSMEKTEKMDLRSKCCGDGMGMDLAKDCVW
jgi:hypothetical protein